MKRKKISKFYITLKKSWDLVHGKGYFSWASMGEFTEEEIDKRPWRKIDSELGFGFSKNKFTAVKNAIKDLYVRGYAP